MVISGAAVRMVCMEAVHGYNRVRAGEGESAPLRACAMAIKPLGGFVITRRLYMYRVFMTRDLRIFV